MVQPFIDYIGDTQVYLQQKFCLYDKILEDFLDYVYLRSILVHSIYISVYTYYVLHVQRRQIHYIHSRVCNMEVLLKGTVA